MTRDVSPDRKWSKLKFKQSRSWHRLLALAIGAMVLAAFGPTIVHAAPPTLESLAANDGKLQVSIDTTWVLLSGCLVFFMQCGFALLEAGLVRQTSVVNTLMENFIDAAVTILAWWAVGFGLAFGTSAGGFFGTDNFFLAQALTIQDGVVSYATGAGGSSAQIDTFALFFYQFCFAATASTITTGALAERTDFVGDLIYTTIMGAISYPIIAHWAWNTGGWLYKLGYHDFAGSGVVHAVGGVTSLVGAWLLGPRPNRVWGDIPSPHNLSLATLGTMILWFGWYGFNSGSTLSMGTPGLASLVSVNTTLAGGAGAMSALFYGFWRTYVFWRTGKWNLFCALNGSLAGLVAVTCPCAYIMPWAAVVIGLIAGVLVIVVVDVVEGWKIDDPVGAVAVHGSCGTWGVLALGLFGQPGLVRVDEATKLPFAPGGLFITGDFKLLLIQFISWLAIAGFTAAFGFVMFASLNAIGRLRVHPKADALGIDVYEHGASAWPDVYPIDHLVEADQQSSEDQYPKEGKSFG